MRIGGLQKCSLIDYPDKISAVVFLTGCNFSCPYCHNPTLARGVNPSHALSPEDISEFLIKRQGLLDGVVISGGEPTIQVGLIGFCEKIKNLGYPIKLDTNGSRPETVKQLLKNGLVDYVAMDIKTAPRLYPTLIPGGASQDKILSSINVIRKYVPTYEFRTTCVRPFVSKEIITEIADIINDAPLYALQKLNPSVVLQQDLYRISDAEFTDEELMLFKSIAGQKVARCVVR